MKKQGGFTLIELVVVIVILGILAVTAAPKFLNLQDDAKVSAVKGLAGAMKGAAGITYGKAAVAGVESLASSDENATIDVDGSPISLNFGYPAGQDDLEAVVDGLTDDWKFNPTLPDGSTVSAATSDLVYGFEGFDCVAIYSPAVSSGVPAKITVQGSADNCVVDNTTTP